MSDKIHTFGEDGYYLGSSDIFIDPVAGRPATVRDEVAFVGELPEYNNLTQRIKRVNGVVSVEDIPEPVIEEPIPEEVTSSTVLRDLFVEYERQMSVISAKFPPSERESWGIQIEEALSITNGESTPTPWINAAASSRGINRSDFAARILQKNSEYRLVHGRLTGNRQRIEDLIDSANGDIELLKEIDVTEGWVLV